MTNITIIMPSYNKEKYIAEALDSIFIQETSYDYHIIVADDCSKDRTIEIVRQYQEKYPNKITLLESDKNQGLYRNVLRAYEITKTDYFCVLDPDDYWTDKYKIQSALDFLEANKDYTIYVTNTTALTLDGEFKPFCKRNAVSDSDFNDYLNDKAELGCTLGSTYRNVIFKNGIPDKMTHFESETNERSFRGDTFRNVIHLHEGKAHCVPKADAVYRFTHEGIWQGVSEIEKLLLNADTFKDMWLYYDKKYPELLINSYKFENKAKVNIVEKLSKIEDSEKLKDIIANLKDLEIIYDENKKLIDQNLNKTLKLKYKMMFYVYNKLYKKLHKKGVV